jgi:hypothetical protein
VSAENILGNPLVRPKRAEMNLEKETLEQRDAVVAVQRVFNLA